MSLFIRCEWTSTKIKTLEQRASEVFCVLENPILTLLIGSEWYLSGESKKDALSKRMAFRDLLFPHFWNSINLDVGNTIHTFGAWNGKDHEKSINISVTFQSGSKNISSLVISTLNIDYLIDSGFRWDNILSSTHFLAKTFRSIAIVSSNELIDSSRKFDKEITNAAYAIYTGKKVFSQSSRFSPCYENKKDQSELIAANSWRDVQKPNFQLVMEVSRLLSTNKLMMYKPVRRNQSKLDERSVIRH